ncbi:MAG: hypothetical protein AB2L24_04290 [Mangrovibacterium sp.]
MKKTRLDNELPESILAWGWKYHHLGIPTDKIIPNEKYLPQFKFYVSSLIQALWVFFGRYNDVFAYPRFIASYAVSVRQYRILPSPSLQPGSFAKNVHRTFS